MSNKMSYHLNKAAAFPKIIVRFNIHHHIINNLKKSLLCLLGIAPCHDGTSRPGADIQRVPFYTSSFEEDLHCSPELLHPADVDERVQGGIHRHTDHIAN